MTHAEALIYEKCKLNAFMHNWAKPQQIENELGVPSDIDYGYPPFSQKAR